MTAETLTNLATVWIPIIVTVASMIAAATPTPSDDRVLKTIYKIIDILAINVGRAKQK